MRVIRKKRPKKKQTKQEKPFNFDKDVAKFTPRQLEAIHNLDSGLTKFLLYGGALGGGKSYFIRWFAVRFLMKVFIKYGFTFVNVMIACEDYPSLKDRQLQKIALEFPDWLGRSYNDHKEYGRCYILYPEYGSGVICFRNLDDASKYASAEFAAILVDELTKNVYDTFTFLRTRLRWPGLKDIECPFVGGTNPGSVGHGWVKQLWMSGVFPDEFVFPIDYRSQFCYVPSKANDNPYLDATYWAMLNTLPIHIRKAFKDGDWDTFVGQVFQEWSAFIHVIDPIPVPSSAPIYMTFDWGFGAPFSVGWWWVDSEGRIYRFMEWYGWNGTPNEGVRLTDMSIAEGIKKKEKEFGLDGNRVIRLASHDCFNKKPDYRGGGQAPPTAEEFRKCGLTLRPTDPGRENRVKQFHARLAVPAFPWKQVAKQFGFFQEVQDGLIIYKNSEGEVLEVWELEEKARDAGVDMATDSPMMLIYNTCQHFIRTIPDLPQDKLNIEDVDTKAEDHVYDEASQICVARPIAQVVTAAQTTEDSRLEDQEKEIWNELKKIEKENAEIMDAFT